MATSVMERQLTKRTPQGIVHLDESQARLQRRVVLALTVIPFAGLLAALVTLWGRGLSVTDFAIMLSFYLFTGLGVTIGFHRLLTHGSFRTPQWVKVTFATAGSMAVQGTVISWVAAHRRHHAYADKEGDPHSPHLEAEDGVRGILSGLWHAHIGWLFDDEKTSHERWAPDLLKNPGIKRVDRLFPFLVVVSFALPAVLGLIITRTWSGAITAFLWGSLVRIFFLHHVTWSVNSICHFYGNRPFNTTDESTNNWPLALISFGESWHNNHHAFPTSAVHGLKRSQLDLSGLFISGMERLGLASEVKRVTPKQLDRNEGAL